MLDLRRIPVLIGNILGSLNEGGLRLRREGHSLNTFSGHSRPLFGMDP